MDVDQLRDRLARILLQQLSNDRYPSATAMEILDQLSGSTRNAYVSVLLDKIEADAYPSPDMVKRVTRLLATA
jgi:hypothetical protein